MTSKRASVREGKERRYSEAHREIIHRTATATNLPDLLTHIARLTSEVVRAPWVTFWVGGESGRGLDVVAELRVGSLEDGAPLAEALETLARSSYDEERVKRLEDLTTSFEGPWSGVPISCMLIPLKAQDSVLGVLGAVQTGREDAFLQDEEAFLRSVAEQSALATKNAWYKGIIRRSEDRLRETELLLLQNERLAALGEMNARMAHELRNPLSAIGGLARRIARNLPRSSASRESADLIVREVQRLEGLLTEYLDMVRSSQPRRTATDLNVVVRETLELVKPQLQQSGIILEEAYSPSLPKLLLDGDKVKQVVLNILKNAMETVEEGDTIHVETLLSDGRICVEVANTGERIPGEILDRLFYSFTTGKSGGTGLGLAISQQIVKEHGGEIHVRSDDAWSAVFTLAFPIPVNRERRAKNRRSGRDRRRAA